MTYYSKLSYTLSLLTSMAIMPLVAYNDLPIQPYKLIEEYAPAIQPYQLVDDYQQQADPLQQSYAPITTQYTPDAGWTKFSQEEIDQLLMLPMQKQPAGRIRAYYRFEPHLVNTNAKPIVLVVIHGTFTAATVAPEYYDSNNKEFQNILRFAQHYAEKQGAPIDVISFGWSGQNKSADRISAGQRLALILREYYHHCDIISISHSHGCNVANVASRYISSESMEPFNYMIQFATPVRDITDAVDFAPCNFNKLIQFYSTSDLVAAAGSLNTSKLSELEGSCRKYARQTGRSIYNIRVQVNGEDPGHSSIKQIGDYLPEIMQTLESNYFYNSDLDLNVRKVPYGHDPVNLVIRNPLATERALEQGGIYDFVDLFNTDAVNSSVFVEPEIKNKLEGNPQEQLEHELAYSKKQEQLYKQLYNRSIYSKNSLLSRFASGVALEVGPYMPTNVTGLSNTFKETARSAWNFKLLNTLKETGKSTWNSKWNYFAQK